MPDSRRTSNINQSSNLNLNSSRDDNLNSDRAFVPEAKEINFKFKNPFDTGINEDENEG